MSGSRTSVWTPEPRGLKKLTRVLRKVSESQGKKSAFSETFGLSSRLSSCLWTPWSRTTFSRLLGIVSSSSSFSQAGQGDPNLRAHANLQWLPHVLCENCFPSSVPDLMSLSGPQRQRDFIQFSQRPQVGQSSPELWFISLQKLLEYSEDLKQSG